MGRKARLVQQCSSGGSRISSITQRDFYIGLLYIFLLAELVDRRILEIIFCIFSIRGGGGAISWTLMGPHNKLFLPAVKKNTLFSISQNWLVGGVTQNVSRLNQVFLMVRDEGRHLSKILWGLAFRGRRWNKNNCIVLSNFCVCFLCGLIWALDLLPSIWFRFTF